MTKYIMIKELAISISFHAQVSMNKIVLNFNVVIRTAS